MQAVRIVEGRRDFVVEDLPAPKRRPGGALVRMEAALVASYMSALPLGSWVTPPRPFTPGQCAIGVVEEGAGRLHAGERVYFDAFTGSRGSGDPSADHGFLGCFAVGPDAVAMMTAWPDGSFSERIHAPEACFTALPEGLDVAPVLLCRLGWLGTALHGLEAGGFRPGMRIAVNGATGILGAGAVVLALALGAAEIIVFGRRSGHLEELAALDAARVRIGDTAVEPRFDMVLDCAGGGDTAMQAALIARLRRFGSYVFTGGLTAPVPLDAGAVMRNSLAIRGSYWFEPRHLQRLIMMVAARLIDLNSFQFRSFVLRDVDAAIEFAGTGAGGLEHAVLVPSRSGAASV